MFVASDPMKSFSVCAFSTTEKLNIQPLDLWRLSVKLVRDKIPTIIRESGKWPDYYVADATEHIKRLFDKMLEELDEFIEDPCLEEAADIYEVFLAILAQHNLSLDDVVFEAAEKWEQRGGFDEGIVLREVVEEEEEWKNYCAWG